MDGALQSCVLSLKLHTFQPAWLGKHMAAHNKFLAIFKDRSICQSSTCTPSSRAHIFQLSEYGGIRVRRCFPKSSLVALFKLGFNSLALQSAYKFGQPISYCTWQINIIGTQQLKKSLPVHTHLHKPKLRNRALNYTPCNMRSRCWNNTDTPPHPPYPQFCFWSVSI